MTREFRHAPVMLAEVVEAFVPVPPGVVIDATLGGGGHAEALLERRDDLSLVGIDRDPDALEAASRRLARFGDRVEIRRSTFDAVGEISAEFTAAGSSITGVLFDLGVSSPQLDNPERGFSFASDGPLDMRMDPDIEISAADIVNGISEQELARLLRDNDEARFARRIAQAIVDARPITTTAQLAAVVAAAMPGAARRRGHPARRVFQAIRIAVNEELEQLPRALDEAIESLVPSGRICVLSYHSGEDRIAKDRLRTASTGGCVCPTGLPCVCGAIATVRLVRAPKMPSPAEIERNPRAESARLRVAERISPEKIASRWQR